MADRFMIHGGHPIEGATRIRGAKNAILPVLAAALLTEGEVIIRDCPRLLDVSVMVDMLESIGCKVHWEEDALVIDPSGADQYEMPEDMGRELRSSIFMLGPIMGRFRQAVCSYPGGCEIGLRPIDLHLKGLSAMNAQIWEEHGKIYCRSEGLKGAEIHLDYPSVGATENIMMAAVRAKGKTVIHNAAKEPEVVDLQRFINAMGGKVRGAGSSVIEVDGVSKLHGAVHTVIPDRIVAGTLMVGAAVTGGRLMVENVVPRHLLPVISKLREAGCRVDVESTRLAVEAPTKLLSVGRVDTMPYPGFPTDMQAQFFAMATLSQGTSLIVENVFENRFRHASELMRMGAKVILRDRMAIVSGVKELSGTAVRCPDLRGGAALVLAGLCANGITIVENIGHIDRGYESLEQQLCAIGADIRRIPS